MIEDVEQIVNLCFIKPSTANLAVGIFLIATAFLVYIPQWLSIVRRKSSYGISFYMLGIGVASSTFTGANAGMSNWSHIECCVTNDLSFGDCLANNLAFIQLFFLMVWYVILYTLFIRYTVPEPARDFSVADAAATRRRAYIVLALIMSSALAVCVSAAVFYYKFHAKATQVLALADIVGYIGAVMMALQFVPQIYTTILLKGPGSFSVAALALGTPGQLLTIYFQGIQNRAKMSTWLPNVFAFVEMAFLLAIIAVFACIRRKGVVYEDRLWEFGATMAEGSDTRLRDTDKAPLLGGHRSIRQYS